MLCASEDTLEVFFLCAAEFTDFGPETVATQMVSRALRPPSRHTRNAGHRVPIPAALQRQREEGAFVPQLGKLTLAFFSFHSLLIC